MNEVHPVQTASADELDYLELDDLIQTQFGSDKENLIMMLQAIQRRYNYLPGPSLTYLSEKVGVPLSQIYGIATFYASFSPGAARPQSHHGLLGDRVPRQRRQPGS